MYFVRSQPEDKTCSVLDYHEFLIFTVYYPEEQQVAIEENPSRTPPPKQEKADDDYLGENVNYDVHE